MSHSSSHQDELYQALYEYNMLINKLDLTHLNHLRLLAKRTGPHHIQFLQIDLLSSSTNASFLTYVLNTLADLKSILGLVIYSYNGTTSFYIGIKNKRHLQTAMEVLISGLTNTFSGSIFHIIPVEDTKKLLRLFFSSSYNHALSSATVVPNSTATTPILNRFYSLMGQENYTAFFLAESISPAKILCLIEELSLLYNTLSMYTQQNHNHSRGLAHNFSKTTTKNRTNGSGNSCTETTGSSDATNQAQYVNIASSTNLSVPDCPNLNLSVTKNNAHGSNHSDSLSCAHGENTSYSKAHSVARLKATNFTYSKAISYSKQNKEALDALAKLNTYITRLKELFDTYFFNFGAFFLSPSKATAMRAAHTYIGVAQNTAQRIEPSYVNTWTSENPEFNPLLSYLTSFSIPHFEGCHHCSISDSALVSSSELANTMYINFTDSSSS